MNQNTLARNIAMVSLGLGLAELLAPRKLAQLIGIEEGREKLLQALGLREIASGLGIMQGNAKYFLWGRVAGDAMDLALLGAAMRSPRSNRRRLTTTLAAVAGVTALDILASTLHSRPYGRPEWRDERPMESRAGLVRDEPMALRASADAAMASYRSNGMLADPA